MLFVWPAMYIHAMYIHQFHYFYFSAFLVSARRGTLSLSLTALSMSLFEWKTKSFVSESEFWVKDDDF